MTEDDLKRDLATCASLATIDCAGPMTTFHNLPGGGRHARVATICPVTDYVTYIQWLAAAVKRWPAALAEVQRLRALHYDAGMLTAEEATKLEELLANPPPPTAKLIELMKGAKPLESPEVSKLRVELAAMTAARDEACVLAEHFADGADRPDDALGRHSGLARVAALRSIGKS